MKDLSEYILHTLHKQKICENWIHKTYIEKPLIIYGDHGCGKSSLAKYILKDFTKIIIDSEKYKQIPNLTTYLNDSFYKKSITMLFQKKNNYKSIIFDDLEYIRLNDKQLFHSIIQFSKVNHRNHPIIYIVSSIQHKDLKSLYNRCFPIEINLSEKDIYYIVRNYFSNDKKHLSFIKTIVRQCHSNFHSIQSNIAFHENKHSIQSYEKKENDHLIYYNKLLSAKDIQEISSLSSYSVDMVGPLNFLENISRCIDHSDISESEKVKRLDKVYYYNCLNDYYKQICLSQTNLNNLHIQHVFGMIAPVLFSDNIQLQSFKNTSIISKSIIYTHHLKLMNTYSIDYEDLFILFCMIKMNYHKKVIQLYINELHLTKKVFSKFMKYYEIMYNYKIPKKQILNMKLF